jgi:hypothetical protein
MLIQVQFFATKSVSPFLTVLEIKQFTVPSHFFFKSFVVPFQDGVDIEQPDVCVGAGALGTRLLQRRGTYPGNSHTGK